MYRRYLDHAAIEELARYKARADREHGKRGDLDQNIKEGRGGIREIELFAQVFQLIYGGETPDLRTGHTLTALDQLGAHGFIDADVQRDLAAAYIFLRNVEHGLQVAQGQQTHTLSGTERGLRALARRLGYDDLDTLKGVLDRHRDRVHAIYAGLFEQQTEEGGLAGPAMFRLLAGDMSDDEARKRLVEAGVDEPGSALDAMRALDAVPSHGRASSRNLLANLLAAMLAGEARPAGLGRVLVRFERVAASSGAAGALFRTLLDDAGLRRRLLAGLDAGDLYAGRLAAYPELLDSLVRAVVDADTFRDEVVRGFDAVEPGGDPAASLDPFRRVKAMQEFKGLVEWLAERRLDRLNEKLSLVADCALRAAARLVSHHRPPGPAPAGPETGWAVFALGKLGGRELTVHSDLDLVFLYDGDGSWFEPQQKFVRAVHELLSKRTGAGAAYEIDTRLRPEGRMGALALSLTAFGRYLDERAEIWERMAWTRCRFAGGDPAVGERARAIVARFVYAPWSPDVVPYARRIRTRIERELAHEAGGDQLDLKRGRGGLADIDFLLQVLQLREGPERPEFRVAGARRLLAAFPETGFLRSDEVEALRGAYGFLRDLETVLRIATDGGGGVIPTDPGAVEPFAQRLRDPMSGSGLLARYREVTAQVRRDLRDGHGPPGRRPRRVSPWPTICWRGRRGFIGAAVAGRLLDAGHAVLGVDDLNDAYDVRLKRWRLDRLRPHERFTFRRADVRDRAGLEAACADAAAIDGVLNLAARAGVRASVDDPWAYVDANVTGTLNLLDLGRARGVRKFVLASTSSLYDADGPMPHREDADTSRPRSPYAATKQAAEAMCHAYHHQFGLDVTVLRYFTVYGPAGRPDMAVFRLVQWVYEGRPVRLYGDGTQSRDFTYVDDAARGTVAAPRPRRL